jgi:transposase-like protein
MRKKTAPKGRKAKKSSASAPPNADTPTTPPAAAPVTVARPVGKHTSKSRSTRYPPEQQAEIVKFVHDHNAKHGRAGQASASKKYSVSVLTISKWLKAAGKPLEKKVPGRRGRPRAASRPAGVETGIEGALKRMLEIQMNLGALRAEYEGLRAKI